MRSERVCAYCGETFEHQYYPSEPERGKYCSIKCAARSRITRETFTCKICEIKYEVIQSDLKEWHKMYCSKKCRAETRKITGTCKNCGKQIIYREYLPRSYCSKKCAGEVKQERIDIICKMCGKKFYTNKYNYDRNLTKYCSQECFTESKRGARNRLWKGGISFEPYCPAFNNGVRRYIRSKFDYRCILCGSKDTRKNLAVHHIDYNKLQGCKKQTWALVPLCSSCHGKTSSGKRWFWFQKMINYWAIHPETMIEPMPFTDLCISSRYSFNQSSAIKEK
jgi:5-methylcytosine-specific restriction endonuclease McrA